MRACTAVRYSSNKRAVLFDTKVTFHITVTQQYFWKVCCFNYIKYIESFQSVCVDSILPFPRLLLSTLGQTFWPDVRGQHHSWSIYYLLSYYLLFIQLLVLSLQDECHCNSKYLKVVIRDEIVITVITVEYCGYNRQRSNTE